MRRNLFTQRMCSPVKKAKLPRSQSVSAVEGLKRKRCDESEGNVWRFVSVWSSADVSHLKQTVFFPERHKLLTKKVCETPLHKQVSSRLLYRQKMGRCVEHHVFTLTVLLPTTPC